MFFINYKIDHWDKDGRYKGIALRLLAQLESDHLIIGEAEIVLGMLQAELNRQQRCARIHSVRVPQSYCKDIHKPQNNSNKGCQADPVEE